MVDNVQELTEVFITLTPPIVNIRVHYFSYFIHENQNFVPTVIMIIIRIRIAELRIKDHVKKNTSYD